MGRSIKFDRAVAVEACMNEFWLNGYEACSVKALSEKLGITRSSFYNAFGSRQDLFLETLDLYATKTPDQVLNHAESAHSVLRLLNDFFADVCRFRASDPKARGCLVINSVSELAAVDEELGENLQSMVLENVSRFERLLDLAVAKGELQHINVHEKALALQSLLMGVSVLSKVLTSEQELLAIVRQTLTGLFPSN
ncbi:TetR/AcrR family transcriptional regulator [Agarivorans sp. 1_MG-2023]|uniref:TetR/AcrR family transcriptional regulator n=1 Tax=Agarivorans sp. 1_MG-2023 TaxID=3062634 RepID=UPI0026E29F85|nr:TetR/AcrR family transcriptional regulator [Agarivorans sp. 1_MG-2023]